MHLLRPARRLTKLQAWREIHRLMKAHRIQVDELVEQATSTVKLTRGPSYTHDPRYQVDPAHTFVGEFTQEWQRKRGIA